eukprot:CAMPEP_0176354306 /NCGR_PEP_ID=MMETSP0126-20121128/12454_1 /TAXON_ID=141414 ORGANISM="Strombidinopsis acuminatum, Strain SPMC142" /NCGR_SAMPLE_ID=MMETSP0126 /ASSEMBLY_ACC=CAM_ASM_000229 /LENGTH=42 /DNA_ID= /DNA_START= /DNA_END= /DNA_ORIENTATION=
MTLRMPRVLKMKKSTENNYKTNWSLVDPGKTDLLSISPTSSF